jgi:hypothetical protein
MSKIEVDAIEPQSGTTLTLGASGDTITIPSGATLTTTVPIQVFLSSCRHRSIYEGGTEAMR